METRLTSVLQWLSRFFLQVAVVAVPLFWLPVTVEKLEINKYFLFYALTLLSLLCFLGRAVMRKQVEWKRTPLDVPLLVLWALYLLVSLLSADRYLSFFGDLSLLGLSFVGLSVFLAFYFLAVQHFSSLGEALTILYLLLVSGSLSAIYFIFKTLGLVSWSWTTLATTNPVHSSNILLGVWLAVVMLTALSLLAVRTQSLALDIFSFLAFAVTAGALVMMGFKMVWVIIAIGLFLLLVFFLAYADELRRVWLSVAFALLVAALLFVFLDFSRFVARPLPVEVSLGYGISWEIARESLTSGLKYFLFGSGPATYAYDFSRFRPESMNYTFVWNLRFGQPFSSAFDWLTTGGVLVSLAWLAVMLLILGVIGATWYTHFVEARRKRKGAAPVGEAAPGFPAAFFNSPLLFWSIAASWITLTVAFWLVNFGMVHWFAWWLLTAMLVVSSVGVTRRSFPVTVFSLKTIPQYALITSFSFILIFTAIVVLGIYLGRFFTAEVTYARTLEKPAAEKVAPLQRAINLNSRRSVFHLALADSFLSEAVKLSGRGGDPGQIFQLVALAVQSAKRATDLAPANVATWEFLSTMYANARAVAPEANTWLVSSLDRSVALEPTNPIFYLGLGNAKLLDRKVTEAVKDFERTVALKPDFILGYLRLAFAKEVQGDISGAVAALEKGLPYGGNNPEYLFHLGRYYFNRKKENDFPLAEVAFQRAIAINQNYSDALFGLAILYEATGHRSEALPLYQRVLELNPGNKELARKVRSLRPPPPPASE
ncbi:MAG: tetratricopeptide repeat protein [Candidatus Magasanikbacteria bacterium]|nr:tetratricopeptide repeat protein [Candidatus Magasanikbacteria bacterium]